MRRLFLIFPIVALFSCGNNESHKIDSSAVVNNYSALEDFKKKTGGPSILFNEYEHDFDSIVQGTELQHTFYFVNDGDEPLILTNVKGSCGCTNVEYPEQPVLPGEKGSITADVNTSGKPVGKMFKVAVRVQSNAMQEELRLWLKGTATENK